MSEELRFADGRFAPRFCPDPNCDGETVRDYRDAWLGGPREAILRCNGLTHVDDESPLIACEREAAALAREQSR